MDTFEEDIRTLRNRIRWAQHQIAKPKTTAKRREKLLRRIEADQAERARIVTENQPVYLVESAMGESVKG